MPRPQVAPAWVSTGAWGEPELAAVMRRLGDIVVVIDAGGRIAWANNAATALVGQSLSAWFGRSALGLLHPDDVTLAGAALLTIQGKAVGTPLEVRVQSASGWRLMELLGSPLDGGYVALVLRDLTERRRWEVASDDVARFRAIVHHSAALTLLLNVGGNVECATAAITRLLGHDPEAVGGRRLDELIAPEDRPAFKAAMEHAVAHSDSGGVAVTVECNLATRAGGYVPVEMSIVALLTDPVVRGLVVSCHDISRLRAAQHELSQLAHHDSLTGLFNRRSFDTALEREWLLTRRDRVDSFVVVFDLDGFKLVNDRHGHAAGDEVLRAVASALKDVGRDTDICGRIGGDEFAVVLVRCGVEAAAIDFVARIQEEVASVTALRGSGIGVSCGYQSLRRSDSAAAALHEADLAMLRTKTFRTHR